MKFTNAILAGAVAVEAASLPQVDKRQTLIPVVKGFQMKPFITALVEAVNDGANLTDILTKPAGLIQSVGAVDVNVTLSLGLTPINSNGRVGGGHEDISNSRVSSVNANARGGCSNPQLRVEWRNMQPNQRTAFIRSVQCLWNAPPRMGWQGPTTRYEELVYVHQQMVGQVHQSGLFLLWHRYFTHVFARMLREECGLAGNMPFPWWDETRDAGNFAASGLFTDEFYGALPRTSSGQGQCVTNGAFANRQLNIGPGGGRGAHCLARGEDPGLTSQVSAAYVNSCVSQSTYARMRECLEYGPHAYGHNGLGPTMADVAAAPSDPIFFAHHAFIDRTFKQWQDQAPSRYTDIYACASPANPCPILGLDTEMTSMGLRPPQRVRDYLDTEGTYACYKYDY